MQFLIKVQWVKKESFPVLQSLQLRKKEKRKWGKKERSCVDTKLKLIRILCFSSVPFPSLPFSSVYLLFWYSFIEREWVMKHTVQFSSVQFSSVLQFNLLNYLFLPTYSFSVASTTTTTTTTLPPSYIGKCDLCKKKENEKFPSTSVVRAA